MFITHWNGREANPTASGCSLDHVPSPSWDLTVSFYSSQEEGVMQTLSQHMLRDAGSLPTRHRSLHDLCGADELVYRVCTEFPGGPVHTDIKYLAVLV